MPRVLYIVYWGTLEQLGQSLVVPAVMKLLQMGASFTLVTFEKQEGLERTSEMNEVRDLLKKHKIDWISLQYHKSPKVPATLFDIANGIARGLQKRLKKKYDIVHARTFVGGLIGLCLAPLIRAKLLYHNEGLYPDEQVDGGVWSKDSLPHRIAKRLENLMYSRADGIIALSSRAKKIIENLPEVKKKETPVIFSPSCVDLERFKMSKKRLDFSSEEIRCVYVGSVGRRYILDKIGRFIATARKISKNATLQIFSKADVRIVNRMMAESGLSSDYWRLEAVSYAEMPAKLDNYQAGLFFLTQGISEHGCSPTKIGEYWASGIPVVTTPNVSDIDFLVRREKVGVIVKEHTEKAYAEAFLELEELLKDPELASRCRKIAENYYALAPACERQFVLYQKLI